jgi:hypothetical protein
MRFHVAFSLATLALLGCGGGQQPTSTSSSTGSGGAAGTGGAGTGGTGATTGSGGTGGTGGGGACTPTAGTASIDVHCDQIRVDVLGHGTGQAQVAVRGRLVGAPGTCFRVDAVDLVQADAALVQHLAAAGVAVHADDIAPWVKADAVAAVVKPCGGDTPRAEAFSVVVQGVADGGTFKASCGAIESGSSWPPRVQLACHDGLDAPPTSDGGGTVDVNTMFNVTSTQVYATVPASDGVTSIDTAARVLPEVWMGQPLAPFDVDGWMASVSPGQPGTTSLQLFADKDLLGDTLCPVPPAMPTEPPPIFLLRVTGQAAHGAFSSELYVNNCARLVM